LASLFLKRDPEIKAFLESSHISRRVALQLLDANSVWWAVKLSCLGRPIIKVCSEDFFHDPTEHGKINTLLLCWPGPFTPRVEVDCVHRITYRLPLQARDSWLEIGDEDYTLDMFPIEIMVLDYSRIFFPNGSKGLPTKAFQRIRSRFKCSSVTF